MFAALCFRSSSPVRIGRDVADAFTRRSLLMAMTLAFAAGTSLISTRAAAQEIGPPEKEELTIGFIKLTDMVPLAVAYEKGFFEDEGLYVTLEPQANWKVVLDGVIEGRLDASHMLASQPLASTMGYGASAEIITTFQMDMNGKAITVSNAVWDGMKKNLKVGPDGKISHPISASALKPVVESYSAAGKPFNMGMVFPVSTHNYTLRYWLAAGGIHPGYYDPANGETLGQKGAEVFLSVVPPPQMPATMEAGTILGYCVGEPWNQQAVFKGIGVPVITDDTIFKNGPDKVFGMLKSFADENPNTAAHLTRALIRAAMWLDESKEHRIEASKLISQPNYVGADPEVISNSMTGTFEFEKGDVRPVPDFNVFFRYNASYPYASDGVWYLTQMRRWGQIAEDKPDAWYDDMARKVFRADIYQSAAKSLIAEGLAKASDFPDFATETGYKPATAEFIDGIEYDGHKPNDYINKFSIGLKAGQKP
jgi:nitrate/nitrite transport system substrate-binding protein